ncbi:MAG: DUF6497 family protein [Pseudomonadota bacterium]
MRALSISGLLGAMALPVLADVEAGIPLPSGLEAHLQEMLWDRPGGGLVYRFRFVSPDFTGDEDFEAQAVDLEHLCNDYAVDRLADIGPLPSRIVISLADRETEFGQFDPDVAQVFESFSLEGKRCVWEMH